MEKRTRTIGLLALAGLLALSAGAVTVLHKGTTHRAASGLIVHAPTLPEGHNLDGEALVNGTLHPLNAATDGLSFSDTPQALVLRLRDERSRYYDIQIANSIALSGLAPKARISVTSDKTVFHDAVPADWNGKIVLDTPPAAPFDISFTQNGHTYRIAIMARIGGAS